MASLGGWVRAGLEAETGSETLLLFDELGALPPAIVQFSLITDPRIVERRYESAVSSYGCSRRRP